MKRTIAIFVGVLLAVDGYGLTKWVEMDMKTMPQMELAWERRTTNPGRPIHFLDDPPTAGSPTGPPGVWGT